jgi:hypothetical protein
MTALGDALAQAREKVARYHATPVGEQDTKAALIEPILRALGWDLEDLDEVRREYKLKTADNPVDYAMLILRTPRLFLEAKPLGGDLDDRRWANQIMGYAAVAGVEWVVLSNGNEYRIYNSHAPVPVDEKLFRAICISDDNSGAEETLQLLSKDRLKENWIDALWKAHFVDRQIRTVLDGLFSAEPDRSLVRLVAKRLPSVSAGDVKAGLTRVRVQLDFPIEPVDTPKSPTAPTPKVSDPSSQHHIAARPRHVGRTPWSHVSLQDLIAAGLIKPPMELEKTHLGRRFTARVEADGRVTYRGGTYDSLSTAGGVARASVKETPAGLKHPQTNGWIFWQFRDENGQLESLNILRRRHFEGSRGS